MPGHGKKQHPMSKKVIWITGASSGIGRELALQYAAAGNCQIILSARRTTVLKEVQKLCSQWCSTEILPFDLKNTVTASQQVEKAIGFFGHVDLLINNGGVSQRSKIMDTDFSVFETLIQVDYLGTVALSRALLPHFIQRQQGHFAVVTSVMGKYSSPYRAGYAGAKHALHGFFDGLRMEHAEDGVAVTLICPGFVQTNISLNALTGDGSALGSNDPTTASGLTLKPFCKKVIRAIGDKQWEVYFGKKEKLGVYLKRISNRLLHYIVVRSNVR